jgi:hypothetical protein
MWPTASTIITGIFKNITGWFFQKPDVTVAFRYNPPTEINKWQTISIAFAGT